MHDVSAAVGTNQEQLTRRVIRSGGGRLGQEHDGQAIQALNWIDVRRYASSISEQRVTTRQIRGESTEVWIPLQFQGTTQKRLPKQPGQ